MSTKGSVIAIIQQYQASFSMLQAVIQRCPDSVWLASNYPSPTWRIAYHATFYTHLYLGNLEEFIPWEKHVDQAQYLGRLPEPPHERAADVPAYSQRDLLTYIEHVGSLTPELAEKHPLDQPSGFDWLQMSRFELHLYNLRHLMQHTGELYERVGPFAPDLPWMG